MISTSLPVRPLVLTKPPRAMLQRPLFRGQELEPSSGQRSTSPLWRFSPLRVAKRGLFHALNGAWEGLKEYGPLIISALLARKFPSRHLRQLMEGMVLFNPPTAITLEDVRDKRLSTPMEDVWFQTEDGVSLHGLYKPPAPQHPTVLISHGNDGSLACIASLMEGITQAGLGLMVYDYRGYGKSKGFPHEAGLYLDLKGASQYLESARGTPATSQILLGHSLGGAVTVHVATHHPKPYRGILLLATFTNIPAVLSHFKKRFWIPDSLLPIEEIFTQRFASDEKINQLTHKLIIMHGETDQTIPVTMGKTLFDHATQASQKEWIPLTGGHCDFDSKQVVKALFTL